MAVIGLSHVLLNIGGTNDSFTSWQRQECLRIEALPDKQVLTELKDIMEGRNYSWHKINRLLQEKLDTGALEYTLEDGDVIFEWNNLCDEKRSWERNRRFSVNCAEYNRDCLLNLKIIPINGGLGLEALQIVTTNMDEPNLSTKDLWVDPDKWESLTVRDSMESLTDDDSSWDSEDTEELESVDDDFEYEDDDFEVLSNDSSEEEAE